MGARTTEQEREHKRRQRARRRADIELGATSTLPGMPAARAVIDETLRARARAVQKFAAHPAREQVCHALARVDAQRLRPDLVTVALAMAGILDDPLQRQLHTAAARQLSMAFDTLEALARAEAAAGAQPAGEVPENVTQIADFRPDLRAG
jgi:hypothetical protein